MTHFGQFTLGTSIDINTGAGWGTSVFVHPYTWISHMKHVAGVTGSVSEKCRWACAVMLRWRVAKLTVTEKLKD